MPHHDTIFRGLYVTPHKVSLLLLIQKYLCDEELSEETKQDLALFIVNEIKVIESCTEKSLDELRESLYEIEDGEFVVHGLLQSLQDMEVLDDVFELFYEVQTLLDETLNEDGSLGAPAVLERGSILGIFVRKLLYTFNELMFEPVSKLFDELTHYKKGDSENNKQEELEFNSSIEMSIDEGEKSVEEFIKDSLGPFKSEMSPAEIEKFVTLRGSKIEGSIGKVHRVTIQDEIDEVVRLFPNIPKAHYLSFLNTLYHKDYEGALESLHRYFDQDLNLPRAVLCLAIVHFRFGHIEEGTLAIHETVRVAQERNDHECLVHALSWLYIFAKEEVSLNLNYEHLLQRCIERSDQLGMNYLSSFSSIELTKHLLQNPKSSLSSLSPSSSSSSSNNNHNNSSNGNYMHSVWTNLDKSQTTNVAHSLKSLAWKVHVTTAYVWELSGNWVMALHSCQLGIAVEEVPLELFQMQLQTQEQGACWPYCKKSYLMYISGDIRGSAKVLLDTFDKFPFMDSCESPWQLTSAQILFEHYLNLNDFVHAEHFSKLLLSISSGSDDYLANFYRQATLDFHMGKYKESMNKCNKLITESSKRGHEALSISYHLLLAKNYLKSGNPDNALAHALGALAQCERYVLHSLWAEATILLAELHLAIGNTRAAMELVNRSATRVMTNGHVIARATLYLIWAKCVLAEDKPDFSKALSYLQQSLKFANLLSVKQILTEIYYLQAIIYESQGKRKERNEAAIKMKETKKAVSCSGVPKIETIRNQLESLLH